jgi:hypothetical protein
MPKKMLRFAVAAVLMFCIMLVALLVPRSARADEFNRVVFQNVVTAGTTNNTPFYNAKILAVRSINLVADKTNVVTLTQVTSEGITNTISALTSTTSVVESNVVDHGWLLLKGDALKVSATTNATTEVTLDNRSR